MRYSKLFQIPDWMVSVPEQLELFFGAARPFGISALLVFNVGKWELF